ncbi:hypothetical protein [Paenibacillus montanisoli]|uniref:Alpha/beta hydrolase n=1 Tax=Paenibacillus montanisoli TaxID=2081970 RepID=A0A328TWD4_9BACL|nr:hypothetical protein [Paenibacillus montanisoli]RAP74660.1 hypothetical protein DL346_21670 [Paenibacillus montanisoli]
MSSHSAKGPVSIYLLSGLATAPEFMESFRAALHALLAREGHEVTASELLFPYGDWSRNVVKQVCEIGLDMRVSPERAVRSIGGRRAVAAIAESRMRRGWQGGRTILVGHSGGGVAAVHAANLLQEQDGGPPSPVVMIGSPRCRIPKELRPSVLFVHAVGDSPRAVIADAICRLGTFGGWGGFRAGKLWQHDKHGPAGACGVPIIGGHADYFREHAPYMNEMGLSNGWLTLQAVWSWLNEKI